MEVCGIVYSVSNKTKKCHKSLCRARKAERNFWGELMVRSRIQRDKGRAVMMDERALAPESWSVLVVIDDALPHWVALSLEATFHDAVTIEHRAPHRLCSFRQ